LLRFAAILSLPASLRGRVCSHVRLCGIARGILRGRNRRDAACRAGRGIWRRDGPAAGRNATVRSAAAAGGAVPAAFPSLCLPFFFFFFFFFWLGRTCAAAFHLPPAAWGLPPCCAILHAVIPCRLPTTTLSSPLTLPPSPPATLLRQKDVFPRTHNARRGGLRCGGTGRGKRTLPTTLGTTDMTAFSAARACGCLLFSRRVARTLCCCHFYPALPRGKLSRLGGRLATSAHRIFARRLTAGACRCHPGADESTALLPPPRMARQPSLRACLSPGTARRGFRRGSTRARLRTAPWNLRYFLLLQDEHLAFSLLSPVASVPATPARTAIHRFNHCCCREGCIPAEMPTFHCCWALLAGASSRCWRLADFLLSFISGMDGWTFLPHTLPYYLPCLPLPTTSPFTPTSTPACQQCLPLPFGEQLDTVGSVAAPRRKLCAWAAFTVLWHLVRRLLC